MCVVVFICGCLSIWKDNLSCVNRSIENKEVNWYEEMKQKLLLAYIKLHQLRGEIVLFEWIKRSDLKLSTSIVDIVLCSR